MVEAESLSTIMAVQVWKFIWRNIFTRFEIPESMVTDNGTLFIDQEFRGFLTSYKVKHHFISVVHPQANGHVEAANKVVLRGLKKRLDEAKRPWADELEIVLWSYWMTLKSTIGETPSKLSYEVDAMMLVELEEPSPRVILWATNSEALQEEVDLSSEAGEIVHIWEKSLKQRITRKYKFAIDPQKFEEGDFVL